MDKVVQLYHLYKACLTCPFLAKGQLEHVVQSVGLVCASGPANGCGLQSVAWMQVGSSPSILGRLFGGWSVESLDNKHELRTWMLPLRHPKACLLSVR